MIPTYNGTQAAMLGLAVGTLLRRVVDPVSSSEGAARAGHDLGVSGGWR